jgi:hypothetical protein
VATVTEPLHLDWYVPTPVRAIQLTRENTDQLIAWINHQPGCEVPWTGTDAQGAPELSISGLGQGETNVRLGDWVIVKPVSSFSTAGHYQGIGFEVLSPEEFDLLGYRKTEAPQP